MISASFLEVQVLFCCPTNSVEALNKTQNTNQTSCLQLYSSSQNTFQDLCIIHKLGITFYRFSVQDHPQCFDAIGWVAGRAFGL